ncbi:MAG TPA: glycine cleavage system aminomethyltransferase GcvT [Candidatus Limnocylindrales bacterium]|nr:glycine cleavage system aminomethyltransferase GcvT [Candidatus Limnocylindrales bacterium]
MRQTALVEAHRQAGGRLIDFAGWEMPVQYRSGILEEHRAVRERAGLFDLSHMGELWVIGSQAGEALAGALVTDPPRLAVGRAHYSMICAEDGGIIDDLIVYRLAEERFLVVPNASNREAVADLLRERMAGRDAGVDDASLRTSLVAIQGPRAASILSAQSDVDLDALRYYSIVEGHACGIPALIARTGYTGEDGFELFVEWDRAVPLWQGLLDAGATEGLIPAGLGARDTLRLEAGMPLYGNELDLQTNPFDAGLGRVVKLDKAVDFVGRDALTRIAEAGPAKVLVGLRLTGRAIARHGNAVHRGGEQQPIGVVTSGAPSPSLGVPIAMAYLPPADAEVGTMVEVAVRQARVEAEVVPLPFYRRGAA